MYCLWGEVVVGGGQAVRLTVVVVGGVPGPPRCGMWSFGVVWGFASPVEHYVFER